MGEASAWTEDASPNMKGVMSKFLQGKGGRGEEGGGRRKGGGGGGGGVDDTAHDTSTHTHFMSSTQKLAL